MKSSIGPALERLFKLSENNTSIRTELAAGLTTFLTMAYIIFVNPQILSEAGVPFSGALFATCLSAAVGSLMMGLLANYPFALAPGMGLNAYFAYTVVKTMGYDWRVALGAVFISGVAFLILTLARIRAMIVDAIPMTMKTSVAAGIGLFIAFIGLKNAGVIAASPTTFVTLGHVTSKPSLLALGGLIITAALMARGYKSAIIIGIFLITAVAIPLNLSKFPTGALQMPDLSSTFMKLDVGGALRLGALDVIFIFLFVDLFDTIGSLMGLTQQAGYLTPEGKMPRVNRALFADAIATIAGALMIGAVTSIKWGDMTEAVPAFLTMLAMPLTFSIANGLALGFIFYPMLKVLTGRWREASPLVYILAGLFVLRYVYLGAE